jgi:hypothetical protein
MKLYSVRTTVKEYSGCKDVVFNWFRHAMAQGRRPYADLVKDYEPGRPDALYTEELIEELFTWDEARQLKDYLERHHGDEGETVIEQVPLPVENRTMGYGCLSVGGDDDFYMLCKESEYSLPFKVWGYYDLEGCELVDGSGVYHHRLWMLMANGEVRRQTNEEAAAMARALAAVERGLMTAEDFRQQWVAGGKEGRPRDD